MIYCIAEGPTRTRPGRSVVRFVVLGAIRHGRRIEDDDVGFHSRAQHAGCPFIGLP